MTPTTPNYFIHISREKWEKGKFGTTNFDIDGQIFLFRGKIYRRFPFGTGTFTKTNIQVSETKKIETYISCKGFCKAANILPGNALFSIDNDKGYHYEKKIIIEKAIRITDLLREQLTYWKEERALQRIK